MSDDGSFLIAMLFVLLFVFVSCGAMAAGDLYGITP